MTKRERDSKFVIYQVLYIFVITVLALKGADLDLRRVALEDETVQVSVRDSLMSVLDSLYSLGIDFSIKIDPNVVVENEEMKKQIAEMNRKLEAVKDLYLRQKKNQRNYQKRNKLNFSSRFHLSKHLFKIPGTQPKTVALFLLIFMIHGIVRNL